MHREIIQDSIDSLHALRDPLLQLLEKINPVDQGSPRVACSQHLACSRLKSSKHISCLLSPAIINLLRGSLAWCKYCWLAIHKALAWITFDGHWTHLI